MKNTTSEQPTCTECNRTANVMCPNCGAWLCAIHAVTNSCLCPEDCSFQTQRVRANFDTNDWMVPTVPPPDCSLHVWETLPDFCMTASDWEHTQSII